MDSIQACAELSQPLLMVLSPKTLGHGNNYKNPLSRCHGQLRNITPLELQIAFQLQVARFHDHIPRYQRAKLPRWSREQPDRPARPAGNWIYQILWFKIPRSTFYS